MRWQAERQFTSEYVIAEHPRLDQLRGWLIENTPAAEWRRIAVLADGIVWRLHGQALAQCLAPLGREIVPAFIPAGETSKTLACLGDVIGKLISSGIGRRDLLLCFGGGACCDLGGTAAMLYMRGIPYVNVPTTLMAQIDGAIGGKVGCNYGARKNLLGGFSHPVLVYVNPSFLDTLPAVEVRSGLAEALKVAIIVADDGMLDLLERCALDICNLDAAGVRELIRRSIEAKLRLLDPDPFEANLDRLLNLGHAVAHTVEGLSWQAEAPASRLRHGEAVAIGLAAVTRYSAESGDCDPSYARRLLALIGALGLPATAPNVLRGDFRQMITLIPYHRGGALRLVVPSAAGGAKILNQVDLDLLTRYTFETIRSG